MADATTSPDMVRFVASFDIVALSSAPLLPTYALQEAQPIPSSTRPLTIRSAWSETRPTGECLLVIVHVPVSSHSDA
jgi:hypothetical protein